MTEFRLARRNGVAVIEVKLTRRDVHRLATAWDVVDATTGEVLGWVVRWRGEELWSSYAAQDDGSGLITGWGEKRRGDAVFEVVLESRRYMPL